MTQVRELWPLLTATHRYDKSISTYQRGIGQEIEAPILAYLLETDNGRILYDVGCDHSKINDPVARARYYNPDVFEFGAPDMRKEQRLPHHLARLGLTPADVDVIFIGHLHFDHAGGLKELRRCGCGAEIHVQRDEMAVALSGADPVVFADDLVDDAGTPLQFKLQTGEYSLLPGVTASHPWSHNWAYVHADRAAQGAADIAGRRRRRLAGKPRRRSGSWRPVAGRRSGHLIPSRFRRPTAARGLVPCLKRPNCATTPASYDGCNWGDGMPTCAFRSRRQQAA